MERITEYLIESTVSTNEVKAWKEVVNLPTYEVGKEEKNPLFLEKRVYQGSSGSVYPYPVIEKIEDVKKDKPYKAVFLENRYVKIMILPELGGRVQMAYDKVRKRHFVYYNQVVKPALVGLTGPWISGGIEFNWPQHHRPTTFMETECMIEEFPDGSKTVWCSEVERMFRTKGMMGFTLYPDKAYLEIKAKIYNRTPFPQTFLWWANPAVYVNDDYYSVFPPDVNAVFDHGKRAVSTFPIATGTYYKVDYSKGVDISRYKNIPVPTSYMAVASKYDFVGGYDEGVQAGLLHVADHHVNAGKKQWTWGNGEFGRAWDRNLTDEDGPYIELMTGMYCDNQPDFSWLQPFEQKSWSQYFMPYHDVGMVKNATKNAVVGINEKPDGSLETVVYATGTYPQSRIIVKNRKSGLVLLDKVEDLSPEKSFMASVDKCGSDISDVDIVVMDKSGNVLVEYRAEKPTDKPVPNPADGARKPEDIENNEQLFLTGLHLEQYRHATYSPVDYYLEALRRDPGDVRCNNAMGLWLLRKAEFEKAEPYFKAAIATLTKRNPNPYDGEPYYNLGVCYKMQGRLDEAYDALYKATWNAAFQDSAYMSLAQIDVQRGEYQSGLEHINRSLCRNWDNLKGRQLKASILRKMGEVEAAESLIRESLEMDKFNAGCRFESYLLSKGRADEREKRDAFLHIMRGFVHNFIEYSLDFAAAGLYDEAEEMMLMYTSYAINAYPVSFYCLGYYASQKGDSAKAKEYFKKAAECDPAYCFPNRIEEVVMMQKALEFIPDDAKTNYYLGNFHYYARFYDKALSYWEKSLQKDDSFPTVLRNLALAYYNKFNNTSKAVECLEKAFMLDTSDSRILMELDQLYKKLHRPHSERLAFLEKYIGTALERDDIYVEMVTLYNQLGRYETAYNMIQKRKFHPWEGGEGKITAQYLYCLLEMSKEAIKEKRFEEAVRMLKEASVYPENLGEGKLATVDENDVNYYLGCAYEGLGDAENATRYFRAASVGDDEPVIAFFYNDQQPDKIYYKAKALLKLGHREEAESIFRKLIQHGQKHFDDDVKIDYFAVSLPDLLIWDEDLKVKNLIHCHLVMSLGNIGLGNSQEAIGHIDALLSLDNNHQFAIALKKQIQS